MRPSDLAKVINQEVKHRTVEEDFIYQLNKTIQYQNSKNTTSEYMNPSQLNKTQHEGSVRLITPEEIGMAEAGRDRHRRLQKYMQNLNGWDLIHPHHYWETFHPEGLHYIRDYGAESLMFHEYLNARFLCDGIMYNQKEGKYYILEIKTEAEEKFRSHPGVNPEDIEQVVAYSMAFKIYDVIFLYENRNTFEKKAATYKVTDILVNRFKEKHRITMNW